SHAHIDHCGNLPNLVAQGFAGPIYCTAATRDLIALMLADSARIQEEEAFVQSVVGRPDVPPAAPHSHRGNVHRTLQQCIAVPYDPPWEIGRDIGAGLVNAGHILGSAMIALTVAGGRRERTVTFTGDLGRRESPLLPAPAPVPDADLVIC